MTSRTPVAPFHPGAAEQAAAWRDRRVPAVEPVRDDVWSIPVPIPGSPLRYVLVYALLGPGRGVTLVDAGPPDPVAEQALADGLAIAGRRIEDVCEIVLTHVHADHFGLVPALQRRSGAGLRLHGRDLVAIASDYGDPPASLPGWIDPDHPERSLGVPLGARGQRGGVDWLCDVAGVARDSALRAAYDDPASHRALGELRPTALLRDGDRITAGHRRLRVIATPGHAPGHVCLLDEQDGLLFAGDHVLPTITPHVAPYIRALGNPLGEFLRSLVAVRDLPVELVLPGHGYRFAGLSARADELIDHHEQRLAQLGALVADRPGTTAAVLAASVDWSRPWATMASDAQLSATGETAAHLLELAARGAVVPDRPTPDHAGRERPWAWRPAEI